jgi:hypothetical protein
MGPHRFELGSSVTEGQRAYYEEFGFIVFGNVLSRTEVETIKHEASELEARTLEGKIPSADVDDLTPPTLDDDGTKRLHRLPYFTRYCPSASSIIAREDIQSLGPGLLGEGAWMLDDTMHGAIWQLKRGGRGSRYSEIRWHLDFGEDHPLVPVVSAGIYLDDSTSQNGCLAVAPMSHRYPPGRLPPVPLLIEASAGDIVCHAYNIYHGSGAVMPEASSRATLYLYFCKGEYPGPNLPFASEEMKRGVRELFVATSSEAAK